MDEYETSIPFEEDTEITCAGFATNIDCDGYGYADNETRNIMDRDDVANVYSTNDVSLSIENNVVEDFFHFKHLCYTLQRYMLYICICICTKINKKTNDSGGLEQIIKQTKVVGNTVPLLGYKVQLATRTPKSSIVKQVQ